MIFPHVVDGVDDDSLHDFEQLLPQAADLLKELSLDAIISTEPDLFPAEMFKPSDLILHCTFGHEMTSAQKMGLPDAARGNPGFLS